MRKILGVVFALIMVSVVVVPVQAQGPSSYESTVNITNLTATPGNITLTYYNPNGSIEATSSDTIAAYETKWYTTLPGLTASFQGSMVISSSVPLGSMSTVIGKDGADNPMNYASYVGTSTGAGIVYLPLLMDSNYGFNTYYSVQNISSSPVDVAIVYSDGLGVSPITSLQPNASVTIDNQAEAHVAKKFSAILTATGNIAVAVVQWADGTYGKPLLSYNGFDAGLTNPILPMVNENNYGYWTAIPVQNLGGTATSVTISYTPTKAGAACTETITIPAYGQVEFGSYAFVFDYNIGAPPYTGMSSTCARGDKFVGSGVVTGNSTSQLLVGLINQTTTILPGSDKGGTLMAINPGDVTDTVIFPDVRQWHGTYNWWTSITIINLSGGSLPIGDVSCHAVGTDPGGAVDMYYSNTAAIPDGAGWITDLYDGWGPMANGFVGGVVCVSATGVIAGTANTLGHTAPADMDTYAIYEGINQ
ncbi:MAG: hypothetical protein ABIG43_05910 [Chloroflexota bacterium]